MLNTAVGYLVYLALFKYFSYALSYSIAFFIGLVFGFFLNLNLVFKKRASVRNALGYVFSMIASLLIGLLFMALFIEVLNIPESLAPILPAFFQAPLSFIIVSENFKGRLF